MILKFVSQSHTLAKLFLDVWSKIYLKICIKYLWILFSQSTPIIKLNKFLAIIPCCVHMNYLSTFSSSTVGYLASILGLRCLISSLHKNFERLAKKHKMMSFLHTLLLGRWFILYPNWSIWMLSCSLQEHLTHFLFASRTLEGSACFCSIYPEITCRLQF